MGCWPPYPAVVLRTVVFTWLVVSSAAVHAATTFNWPTSPGWTGGSGTGIFTQSFTDGVAPNDITVTIDNSLGETFNTGYPQISASPNTGGLTGVNALQLYVTASPSTGSPFIRTTVSFANPVVNLSFQLWDVDANPNQFIDKIANIQALAQGGGTVGATSVTSVNATYNTVSGTGLSTVVLGKANASNTTNQGSVNITFAGPITQFSFDWSNTASGLGAQAISLAPLTYTIVPEAQSLCSVTAACLAAILCGRLRKARNRPEQERLHRSRNAA